MASSSSRNSRAQLILASSSPRRIELLKAAGLRFKVIEPDIDETERSGESPRAMVLRLSLEKALAVSQRLKRGQFIVLSADTTVVHPLGKKTLGKPESKVHAARLLKQILGQTHTVLTGYTLLEVNSGEVLQRLRRAVSTRVSMRRLSRAEIQNYIATGEPMDKAGAYAAQGIGMTLIRNISGSYTNVVGLPVCEVLSDLEKYFGDS